MLPHYLLQIVIVSGQEGCVMFGGSSITRGIQMAFGRTLPPPAPPPKNSKQITNIARIANAGHVTL